MLEPPPKLPPLQSCLAKYANPDACEGAPDELHYQHAAGERAAAAETSLDYIDTLDWFCVQENCPGFVGATPVMADGAHMTIQYSRQLAPLLREALLP